MREANSNATTNRANNRRARSGQPTAGAPILPPDMPPDSPEEAADKQRMIRMMQEISRNLHQRNLTNTVALAQQALRDHGPLVDHFAELGRRYGHLLQAPPRPKLTVVQGKGG